MLPISLSNNSTAYKFIYTGLADAHLYPRRPACLNIIGVQRGERGIIMNGRLNGLIVCIFVAMACVSHAEIPQMIGYQGMVTDATGDPVADGDYSMRFRIYNTATGGTALWDSGVRTVALYNGIFNVLLGESPQPTLELPFGEALWLLVTFSGENQLPRQKMASTGYAYMASGLVPGTSVSGELSGMFQPAINGTNTASTGTNFGLSGISHSTSGTGVFGYGYATTGTNYGIYGQTDSSGGYGIFGYNPSGWAGGFDGSVSIDGRLELPDNDATPTIGSGAIQIGNASRAVRLDGNEIITNSGELLHLQRDNDGRLSVDDGTLFVDGSVARVGIGTDTPEEKFHVISSAPGEIAIKGEATATTGVSYAGYFSLATSANAAKAVYGAATATTGTTYGGLFESYSSSGTGVRGRAAANSGDTRGVYGVSSSPTGIGVYGLVTANSASINAGVYGESTASSGETYGVWGENASTAGAGILGFGTAESGDNIGIYGATLSPDGNGIYGFAVPTEGLCVGVVGITNSDEGYGVYYMGGLGGIGLMRSYIPANGGYAALGIHTTAGDWVEYFGEGVLQGGEASIQLNPQFLEAVTINSDHPMKVFIQLHDENCQGVAVKKSKSTFKVIELNSGRSNSTFDYRVVAKRKGYQDNKLGIVQGLPTEPRNMTVLNR